MSAESGRIQPLAWHELGSALRGRLLLPGEAGYASGRRVWNGAIDRHPLAIVQCEDAGDVVAAVKFAAREHVFMSVRGGGHNVAGLAVRDGALMLDLGAMNRIDVNAPVRRVSVQGGALWRDVDAASQPHGLATTGGLVSTTGVGGFTLGGGVGWLMRRCGLAIDNLLEADVVLADGRSIVANETQHADLFWALRGGAGGFGVATRFVFRLHEVGNVLAGAVFHPLEAAPSLLRAFRDFAPDAPDECTLMLAFVTAPPAPFLPEMAHGKRAVVLAYCWSGDPAQGARVLEPLTRFGRPLGQVGGVMPYAAWQQTFDSHAPAGDHYYWTTSQFDTLADALVDVLVPLASAPPDYDCEVHVHHMGGAVARVGQGATAFAHRDVGFFVNAIGRTRVAERLAGIRDWTRAMRSALAPYARNDVQPNFAGEMAEASTHAHDAATRAKLLALRERYDPEGLLAPVRAPSAT